MPFIDSLKKFFGISDSRSQSNIPSNDQQLDAVDRQTLGLQPYGQPSNNDFFFENDQFFEQGFQQLENFMRSLPMFGFPFGFGPSGPFQSPDPFHGPPGPFGGSGGPFGGPSGPESGMVPFHGFSSIFGPGDFNRGVFGPEEFHRGGFGPTIEDITDQENVSPRDEVLKPSYRSSARVIRDEDYDSLVKEKGPDVILDMLKKSEEAEQNQERQLVPAPGRNEMAPRSFGKFTSTKFSWVNGKSVQEQITSLPDGTFEKRVTTTGPDGETNVVVSQHTAEEVMPQSRGGFGGGLFGFGNGFGSRFGGPF